MASKRIFLPFIVVLFSTAATIFGEDVATKVDAASNKLFLSLSVSEVGLPLCLGNSFLFPSLYVANIHLR